MIGKRLRSKHTSDSAFGFGQNTNSERRTHGMCKYYGNFPVRKLCWIKHYFMNCSKRSRAIENIENEILKRVGRNSIRRSIRI